MFAAISGQAHSVVGEELARMARALGGVGRAPSLWIGDFAGLAGAPAGILPEDIFDTQPWSDERGAFACDARLDNRDELAGLLTIEPAQARVMADSEILRRAFAKWGADATRFAYGDYAFVAWESETGRLTAATDHLGTIPIFYHHAGDTIFMATQLASLMCHAAVPKTLDQRALGLIVAPKLGSGWTMFEGISHLPGGSLLTFSRGRLETRRWWQPERSAPVRFRRDGDYVEHASALFDDAVAQRLRANGSVVATMSGGLDSTLVTAAAARRLARSGQTLAAFTSVPEPGLPVEERRGWDADDGAWAAKVAAFHPNIVHHLVPPNGMIPLDILPAIHARSRTAVRNTANQIWLWKINEAALAGGARVVLNGQRGNASLSVDGRYAGADWLSGAPYLFLLRKLAFAALDPSAWLPRLESAAAKIAERRKPPLFREGAAFLSRAFRAAHADAIAKRVLLADPHRRYLEAAVTPQKMASMDCMAQFGVEWRDPTADRRLIEALVTYPMRAFRAGGRDRGLARGMGRDFLPDAVRLRRSRGAQCADEFSWFALRAADYMRVLEGMRGSPVCREILDLEAVANGLETLCAGRGDNDIALSIHRALDVGLFAMEYECGQFARADSAYG